MFGNLLQKLIKINKNTKLNTVLRYDKKYTFIKIG